MAPTSMALTRIYKLIFRLLEGLCFEPQVRLPQQDIAKFEIATQNYLTVSLVKKLVQHNYTYP